MVHYSTGTMKIDFTRIDLHVRRRFLLDRNKNFEVFTFKVIRPLRETFEVGAEHKSTYKYLGLCVSQYDNQIMVDQITYAKNLKPIKITGERKSRKEHPLRMTGKNP